MELKFGEKIKDARKSKGLTQKQLAEKIGAKHNSVSDWENDKNKPDPDTIELLCGVLGISPNYLLNSNSEEFSYSEKMIIEKYRALDDYGKETIDIALERETARVQSLATKDSEISKLKEQIDELNVPKRIFAYYGKIAAAGNSYGFDNVIAGLKEYPINDVNEKADYTIGVSGDSMEPTFYDGDIVYVKKVHHLNIGDIGIFQKENGIYIKEVGENGLISHNDQYKPMINGGDVICLGKVLGKAE